MIRARFALQTLIAIAAVAATAASGQAYPARPIHVVVPYMAGTGVDTLARTLAEPLGKRMGQSVVVENKPGASGNIGTEYVAKSPADGYTVLLTSNSFVIVPAFANALSFDPVADFAPVGGVAVGTLALVVHPSLGVSSVAELIALAKRQPGQLNYASPGNGTPHHLAMELFKQSAGVDIVHISYKGSSGAVIDVVSGRVPMMILAMPLVLPYAATGKLKVLAVLGDKRSPQAPDVPTFREAGVENYSVDLWYSLFAPAHTPRDIVNRLQREFATLLADPELRESLTRQGLIPASSTPDELSSLVRKELVTWRKLVKDAKITAD